MFEMRMFDVLEIETCSTCNRKCPTCLRQSYPDMDRVADRFSRNEMSEQVFQSIVDQAAALGFRGTVCLQHYNEPLLDRRLSRLAGYVRSKGVFGRILFYTNGDLLTEDQMRELEGLVDEIGVASYDGYAVEREAKFRSWSKSVKVVSIPPNHLVTHFSPLSNSASMVESFKSQPCEYEVQVRCIFAWTGDMLLCCDDIVGEWSLGNIRDVSLRDLWFGNKHRDILEKLSEPGGRDGYGYCRLCPRPNIPYWSKR